MAKKILIIDDEADVMKMVVYRLKAKGYEIMTASSGKEGIDITRTNKPDLILLDYRLPDVEPGEVSKTIRKQENIKNIPIILITASVDHIKEKAKECLANDFIPKPIEPKILYEKIEKYI